MELQFEDVLLRLSLLEIERLERAEIEIGGIEIEIAEIIEILLTAEIVEIDLLAVEEIVAEADQEKEVAIWLAEEETNNKEENLELIQNASTAMRMQIQTHR